MKRFLQMLLLAGLAVSLTACGNLKNSDLSNNPTTSTRRARRYQTTTTSKGGYSVLLKNGRYRTSPISGLSATDNDNDVDTRAYEQGLIDLSKRAFSTNRYVFQEGQQISTGTANDWLARKSKKNPEGLNPVDNHKKDASTRAPIRLEQIQEQDYLSGSRSNYHIAGMSIGLAMNSVDYFTKKEGGPQYHSDISRAEQESYGKKAANEIVARLRKDKKLKNIPILVGLFSKTSADSLSSGNYFAYGIANANSSKISSWKKLDMRTQTLPTIGDVKPISSNDASDFSNFKAAVQDYFPDISGVTASVKYTNGKLTEEDITITTQFYGYAQIESFTKLTLSAARKYLPSNAAIEIKISSVNSVQALIAKNSAGDNYYVHVFNGE